MLVNKTVEFFLSEAVRLEICGVRRRARSEMPAGTGAGLAADSERDAGGGRGWAGSGTSKDRVGGGKITGAGGGLGARCRRAGIGWQPDVTAADRCRVEADAGGCRGWARSGTSRDRVGGNQITSKESAL